MMERFKIYLKTRKENRKRKKEEKRAAAPNRALTSSTPEEKEKEPAAKEKEKEKEKQELVLQHVLPSSAPEEKKKKEKEYEFGISEYFTIARKIFAYRAALRQKIVPLRKFISETAPKAKKTIGKVQEEIAILYPQEKKGADPLPQKTNLQQFIQSSSDLLTILDEFTDPKTKEFNVSTKMDELIQKIIVFSDRFDLLNLENILAQYLPESPEQFKKDILLWTTKHIEHQLLPYFEEKFQSHYQSMGQKLDEEEFKTLPDSIKNIILSGMELALIAFKECIVMLDKIEIQFGFREGALYDMLTQRGLFAEEKNHHKKPSDHTKILIEKYEALSQQYKARMSSTGYPITAYIEDFPYTRSKIKERKKLLEKTKEELKKTQDQYKDLEKNITKTVSSIIEEIKKIPSKKQPILNLEAAIRKNKEFKLADLEKIKTAEDAEKLYEALFNEYRTLSTSIKRPTEEKEEEKGESTYLSEEERSKILSPYKEALLIIGNLAFYLGEQERIQKLLPEKEEEQACRECDVRTESAALFDTISDTISLVEKLFSDDSGLKKDLCEQREKLVELKEDITAIMDPVALKHFQQQFEEEKKHAAALQEIEKKLSATETEIKEKKSFLKKQIAKISEEMDKEKEDSDKDPSSELDNRIKYMERSASQEPKELGEQKRPTEKSEADDKKEEKEEKEEKSSDDLLELDKRIKSIEKSKFQKLNALKERERAIKKEVLSAIKSKRKIRKNPEVEQKNEGEEDTPQKRLIAIESEINELTKSTKKELTDLRKEKKESLKKKQEEDEKEEEKKDQENSELIKLLLSEEAGIPFLSVQKEECDLSLMSSNDINLIKADTLKKAEQSNIPILIKQIDQFFIYGDKNGNDTWAFTEIKKDATKTLNNLSFPNTPKILKRGDPLFSEDLINALKAGHTSKKGLIKMNEACEFLTKKKQERSALRSQLNEQKEKKKVFDDKTPWSYHLLALPSRAIESTEIILKLTDPEDKERERESPWKAMQEDIIASHTIIRHLDQSKHALTEITTQLFPQEMEPTGLDEPTDNSIRAKAVKHREEFKGKIKKECKNLYNAFCLLSDKNGEVKEDFDVHAGNIHLTPESKDAKEINALTNDIIYVFNLFQYNYLDPPGPIRHTRTVLSNCCKLKKLFDKIDSFVDLLQRNEIALKSELLYEINNFLKNIYVLIDEYEIRFCVKENIFLAFLQENGLDLDDLTEKFYKSVANKGYEFPEEERYPYRKSISENRQKILKESEDTEDANTTLLDEIIRSRVNSPVNNQDPKQQEAIEEEKKNVPYEKVSLRKRALEKDNQTAHSEIKTEKIRLLTKLIEEKKKEKEEKEEKEGTKSAVKDQEKDIFDISENLDHIAKSEAHSCLLFEGQTGKVVRETLDEKITILDEISIKIDQLKEKRDDQFWIFSSRKTLEMRITFLEKMWNLKRIGCSIEEISKGQSEWRDFLSTDRSLVTKLVLKEKSIPAEKKQILPRTKNEEEPREDITKKIKERATNLQENLWYPVKKKKYRLLIDLKQKLEKFRPFEEAMRLIKEENPKDYHLLYEGRTGEMIREIEHSLLTREQIIARIDRQILVLRGKYFERNYFFSRQPQVKQIAEDISFLKDIKNNIEKKLTPEKTDRLHNLAPDLLKILEHKSSVALVVNRGNR